MKTNKKGISLIVLVITIIVMIILAAAIILSLSGNGIIGRANEAKEGNDLSVAKEVVAVSYSEWLLNQSKIKSKNPQITEFWDYVKDELEKSGYETGEEETIIINGKSYIVKDNGTVSEKKKLLVDEVTPENYGDSVVGYTAGNVSDWEIFSVEGENVWLISSDFVNLDEETCEKTGLTSENKSSWWAYDSDGDDKNRADAIADYDNWTSYVNSKYAICAQGGPSIEMLMNSINEKTNNTFIDWDIDIYNSNGEYIASKLPSLGIIGMNKPWYSGECNLPEPNATIMILSDYCINTNDEPNITGFNVFDEHSYTENTSAIVPTTFYYNGYLGIRPVVKLHSTVACTYADGVWTVE